MKNMKQIRRALGGLALTAVLAQMTGCAQLEEIKEKFYGSAVETETELVKGQRMAKIQVVSITGNELTYIEEETEAESEAEVETETEVETEGASETPAEVQEIPAAEDNTSQKNRGQMNRGGGQRPDMSQMFGGGEMPDMSRMPGGGEMPDMSQMFGGGNSAEAVTVYLPVGVKVYTDTGKQMSFAILETGDNLEVLFETNEAGNEVITVIQMLGE